MAISVDPLTDIIYIPKADLTLIQASPEVREIDLNWFHLQLKDWGDSEEAIPRPDTHNHNTEVSLAGLTYARIIEILDPYTVEFEDGQYTVNCVGANHNISDKKVANQVSLIVNNAAGLIGNAQIEYASFNGGITVDEGNVSGKAVSGTIFPIGTPQQPVDNWSDALLIDGYRGFNTFYVEGDATIPSIDISDKEIYGQSPNRSTITINTLSTTDGVVFHNATVTGTLDGDNHIVDCVVNDLNYVNGKVLNCGLIGDITLGGGSDATFNDCYTVDQDDPPVIDMGGSGQSLAMPNYSGLMTLKNLSDVSSEIGVGVNHGAVILEPTISAGTIIVAGVGTITDNSTGTTYVNTDALISKTLVSQAVWDQPIADHLLPNTMGHQLYHEAHQHMVTINTVDGSAGTAFPIGTHEYPVDNLSDALTIASNHGFQTIHVQGSLTIDGENIEGYTFTADRSLGNSITITSMVNAGACYFQDLTVSGALTGSVRFTTCVLGALTDYDGGAKNCLLTDQIEIVGAGANYFTDCDTYVTGVNYIEIDIGDHYLNLIRCRGAFTLQNKLGAAKFVVCDFASASVIVDSSCTEGFLSISGNVSLTDNSGPGCTLLDGTFTQSNIAAASAEAVWTDSNGLDVLSDLAFIKNIEGGKWEISAGDMVFYMPDNVTEIARFTLAYDGEGNPISRTRV